MVYVITCLTDACSHHNHQRLTQGRIDTRNPGRKAFIPPSHMKADTPERRSMETLSDGLTVSVTSKYNKPGFWNLKSSFDRLSIKKPKCFQVQENIAPNIRSDKRVAFCSETRLVQNSELKILFQYNSHTVWIWIDLVTTCRTGFELEIRMMGSGI